MLHDRQIEIIKHRVENSITIPTLRDDLLDHLCCVIEIKLEEGKSFEIAFEEACYELAPEGFYEIEEETILLLNAKAISMKKFMYSIGLVTAISMTMGLMFKILSWPGADQLFVYGFIVFGLIFLPMVMYSKLKSSVRKSTIEKLQLLFGGLSALATALSLIFKLLHLQGADVLLIAGAGIFSFAFLPLLFFSLYKQSSIVVKQRSE